MSEIKSPTTFVRFLKDVEVELLRQLMSRKGQCGLFFLAGNYW